MVKNGPKMGFGDFLGKSLVLSQNCGECEQLLPFNILQNLLLWEKSDSQFMAKNALGPSDFSIYSLIINISLLE